MTRFLYTHLKGRRLLVFVAIALTFVGVLCSILLAFPLKFILDKIIHHTDPDLPFFGSVLNHLDHFGTRNGLSDTEVHTQLGVILFSALMALTLAAIGAVVSFVQLAIAAFVAQDFGARLRNRVFVHVEHLPLEWHIRQRVGDVVQRISTNVTDIEKLITDGLVDLVSGILTLVGIVIVMLLLNWQFTMLSMLIVPPLFVLVVIYTRKIKRSSKATSRAAGQVAEVATENVGAIAELKAFTLERWAARSFANRVEHQRGFAARAGRLQSEFNPLVMILIALTTAFIISVGSWLAAGHGHRYSIWFLTIPTGTMTIGTLTVFLSYSKMLYQPMRDLSKLTLVASNASSAIERIQEVLEQPWEEQRPDADHPGPADVRGSVVFRGVVFGYEEERAVLHGIDLEVPMGSRVALVGLSGSGKTTLVRLLPRFYEPWQGTITIDGVDIRNCSRDVLRRNIGMVLQDSVLFEGTIRDNIVLDREDASDEEVVAAAKQACIHDTIMDLPDGYDAQVREHGKNFSSGQRQRIAIARAILRNAPILILDEPTANLDVEAEAEVMRAIERLTEGRTVIIISHRLSALGHVDEIAVLEGGRIVEHGTYQQLKTKGGAFARLLAEQNRYAVEPIVLPGSAVESGQAEVVSAIAAGADGDGLRGDGTGGPGESGADGTRSASDDGHPATRTAAAGNGEARGNGEVRGNGAAAIPASASRRIELRGPRLLIYTQDGLGLGHLRRASSLATAFLDGHADGAVLTISDSPAGTLVRELPNHDYLKLPSVVKAGPGDWHALGLPLQFREMQHLRSRVILEAATAFHPDVLLVDHMPHGAMGELVPTLEALRKKPTRIVLGLRDIIDSPDVVQQRWQAEGALDVVTRYYDQVLVYGCQDLFDVGEEYGWPAALARLVRYCGYVCTPDRPDHPERIRSRSLAGVPSGRLVVAMAGGGADGYPLMSTLVDALPKIGSGQPTVMVLVTGPFMPEAERKALKSKAEKLPVRVRGVVRDPMSYFAAADLVVAMSGYNTTVELLRVGTPALLVPREGPSSEQRMRAQRFAERGWVSQLDPRELAPDRLAAVMREALSAGRRQPTAPADLAGLGRAVEHLHTAALAARAPSRISPRPPAAVKLWD